MSKDTQKSFNNLVGEYLDDGSPTGNWVDDARIFYEAATVAAEAKYLPVIEAAHAVVKRWHEPSWKDVPATANFIYRLRDALDSLAAPLLKGGK